MDQKIHGLIAVWFLVFLGSVARVQDAQENDPRKPALKMPALAIADAQTSLEAVQAKLDQKTQKRIIEWVCDSLNENYVYPEVSKKMETHVKDKCGSGKYNRITDIEEFTRTLTQDLRSVCNDRHLLVRFNPDPPPPDTSTDEEKENARKERIERERQENFDFNKVERLSGNVGYLRFDRFRDARYAGSTAVAAMNFLANCDALIIDLRYNGGGNGTMIQLLLSYFFDEPVHYNNMYFRKRDVTEQNWTSAYVEGPKMTDVDLYVLTSNHTFSAAEEFTYDLKNLDRATLVGETTGGGAHPVEFKYLRDMKIELKVPCGRSFNPDTGLDWEGTGIEPHVQAAKAEAFDTAYILALENLFLKAKEDEKEIRKWQWEYQDALVNPVPVGIKILKSYAGQYGPLRVTFDNDRLFIFEPGDSEPKRLFPLSDTLFVIDGNDRIRGEFERAENGDVVAVHGIMADGSKREFPKSK